jgi:hypothetical protein
VAAPFSPTLLNAAERATLGDFLRHQYHMITAYLNRQPRQLGA